MHLLLEKLCHLAPRSVRKRHTNAAAPAVSFVGGPDNYLGVNASGR
jgi:hypothetical protein